MRLLQLLAVRLITEHHPALSINGAFHDLLVAAAGLPNNLSAAQITQLAEIELPTVPGVPVFRTPSGHHITVDGELWGMLRMR